MIRQVADYTVKTCSFNAIYSVLKEYNTLLEAEAAFYSVQGP